MLQLIDRHDKMLNLDLNELIKKITNVSLSIF